MTSLDAWHDGVLLQAPENYLIITGEVILDLYSAFMDLNVALLFSSPSAFCVPTIGVYSFLILVHVGLQLAESLPEYHFRRPLFTAAYPPKPWSFCSPILSWLPLVSCHFSCSGVFFQTQPIANHFLSGVLIAQTYKIWNLWTQWVRAKTRHSHSHYR